MAALLYLPRLFVYHFDAEIGSVQSETFKVMEQKLYRFIMGPAMIVAWLAGLYLVYLIGAHKEAWFICKFFLVIILSAFHGFQGIWLKEFARDERKRSGQILSDCKRGSCGPYDLHRDYGRGEAILIR